MVAATYLTSFLRASLKLEMQSKKGRYFSFDFDFGWYSIHLYIRYYIIYCLLRTRVRRLLDKSVTKVIC